MSSKALLVLAFLGATAEDKDKNLNQCEGKPSGPLHWSFFFYQYRLQYHNCGQELLNGYTYIKHLDKCDPYVLDPYCEVRTSNNFYFKKEDCEKSCKSPKKQDICTLPPTTGKKYGRACTLHMWGYAYNHKSKTCESEIHNNCQETTLNSFQFDKLGPSAMWNCQKLASKCTKQHSTTGPCGLAPFKSGKCRARMSFYTYNKETMDCEMVSGCTSEVPANTFRIIGDSRAALSKCIKFAEKCTGKRYPSQCKGFPIEDKPENPDRVSSNCHEELKGFYLKGSACKRKKFSPCDIHTLNLFPYLSRKSRRSAMKQCRSFKKECKSVESMTYKGPNPKGNWPFILWKHY